MRPVPGESSSTHVYGHSCVQVSNCAWNVVRLVLQLVGALVMLTVPKPETAGHTTWVRYAPGESTGGALWLCRRMLHRKRRKVEYQVSRSQHTGS